MVDEISHVPLLICSTEKYFGPKVPICLRKKSFLADGGAEVFTRPVLDAFRTRAGT